MRRAGSRARLLALLAATAVLVAACGGQESASSGAGGSTTPGATAPAQDAGEKVLTVAIGGDIETFDPCCANFINSHYGLLMVYEVPVIHPTVDVDGAAIGDPDDLEGLYFESWQVAADGVTYTIKVRQGLTMHDGTPINAESVRYMVERNLDTPGGGNWLLRNIAFVTQPPQVIGEYELRLVADQPSPMTMQSFYMSSSAAIDREVVDANASGDDVWATAFFQRNVVNGSGPYKLVSRVPDQELVFEAFDGYWRGRPAYDRIIFKIVPSAAERVQLLRSGAVDVALGLGTTEFAALSGAQGVKVIQSPSANMVYIGLGNQIAPMDNKALRQAISYAVDYDDILANVYQNDARRLRTPINASSPFSIGDQIGYDRDLGKARELLAQAGYTGQTLTLSIDSSRSEHELIAVRVQAALREAGITVEIEQLTPAVFAERKVGDNRMQMFIDEGLPWIDDPNYTFSIFLECGVFGNYAQYCNERVDEIIAEGWVELSPARRLALFAEAQRLIVDDAPWVFLAQPNYKFAMRDTVDGYVHYPNEIARIAQLRPAS
jgi:peptide/nickel transport system substrate-binding protein